MVNVRLTRLESSIKIARASFFITQNIQAIIGTDATKPARSDKRQIGCNLIENLGRIPKKCKTAFGKEAHEEK
ncbi:hypothetical protein CEV33_1423 [Brucella grignonensis]|uniref:Uncharacterized protein n=1 Tax=Brucella grignonensis TaxID=94627 RepID=A0A256FAV2_9HYPH|nr:hypothetical protein CEV33_1423 [Brucella grignonensis]